MNEYLSEYTLGAMAMTIPKNPFRGTWHPKTIIWSDIMFLKLPVQHQPHCLIKNSYLIRWITISAANVELGI